MSLEVLNVLVAGAETAVRNADWTTAQDIAALIRTRFPAEPRGFLLGAQALEGDGCPLEADALLRDGVELLPQEQSIAVTFGWLAHRTQRWEEALVRWATVRQRFPDAQPGYIGAATALRTLGRLDQADALLREAIGRFPTNPTPTAEYAWTAMARRDFAAARERWAAMRERFPGEPLGFVGGGLCERDRGALDAAEALFAEGERRFPGNTALQIEAAWLANRRADWDDARARWQRLQAMLPTNPTVKAGLAELARLCPRDPTTTPGLRRDGFVWHERRLELVAGPTGAGILRRQIEPPLVWRRPAPVFAPDLSGLSRGEPPRSFPQERHAKFLTTIENCALFGTHHFHAALQDDGRLNQQFTDINVLRNRLTFYLSRHAVQPRLSPLIEPRGDFYVASTEHLADSDAVYLSGPVFFGSPDEPQNYGMWLVNGLSSAADFVRAGGQGQYLCWIGAPWQRRLLHEMGVADERIVVQEPHRLYFCDSLTLQQYTRGDLTVTPDDIALFASLRERCLRGAAKGPERIYVSRRAFTKTAGYRALQNEDALIDALQARGFAIVEPETMPFQAQVALFGQARVVIGLGGAGMFNTIFCPPGAKVVSIESALMFAHMHANLFASCGHQYGVIFGTPDADDPAPVHKRWHLDVPAALPFIDGFV